MTGSKQDIKERVTALVGLLDQEPNAVEDVLKPSAGKEIWDFSLTPANGARGLELEVILGDADGQVVLGNITSIEFSLHDRNDRESLITTVAGVLFGGATFFTAGRHAWVAVGTESGRRSALKMHPDTKVISTWDPWSARGQDNIPDTSVFRYR